MTVIMNANILLAITPVQTFSEASSDNEISYIIGGIIAILIMGYQIYTLFGLKNFKS